jgi:hypothetical protein
MEFFIVAKEREKLIESASRLSFVLVKNDGRSFDRTRASFDGP